MADVIPISVQPDHVNSIYQLIKHKGIKFAQKVMLDAGEHPAYVRAIIKRVISTRGW